MRSSRGNKKSTAEVRWRLPRTGAATSRECRHGSSSLLLRKSNKENGHGSQVDEDGGGGGFDVALRVRGLAPRETRAGRASRRAWIERTRPRGRVGHGAPVRQRRRAPPPDLLERLQRAVVHR